jgi:hypothetical protein
MRRRKWNSPYMKIATTSLKRKFPFASEFVTDSKGRVSKVILDLPTFERLIEELEDEGHSRDMKNVEREKPLSKSAALKQLARD